MALSFFDARMQPDEAYSEYLRIWPFKSGLARGEGLFESVQLVPSGVTLRYVVGGSWSVEMLGETREFGSGSLFCTMPSERVVFKQLLPASRWEWRELQFKGPGAEGFLGEFGLSAANPAMLPARPERALRLLKHLHELMRAGRPAALVSASFALLDACVGTPLKPVDQGYGGLVRKAKLLLESELIAGGGVEKLSASLGVERTTLFRAFKAEAGVSPHEYIDKLKLHRAMELLSSTKIPVSSAAAQCGFSDVKYFTSWFKAKVGQPPAAWRARREREKES